MLCWAFWRQGAALLSQGFQAFTRGWKAFQKAGSWVHSVPPPRCSSPRFRFMSPTQAQGPSGATHHLEWSSVVLNVGPAGPGKAIWVTSSTCWAPEQLEGRMPGECCQNWTCRLLPRFSANQPEYRSAEDGKRAWTGSGSLLGIPRLQDLSELSFLGCQFPANSSYKHYIHYFIDNNALQ